MKRESPNLNIQKEITDLFRQWLETEDAIKYLTGCAANIINKIPPTHSIQDTDIHDASTRAEELAHDILVFILESFLPETPSSPDRMNLLIQNKFQAFLSMGANRFLGNRLDRARSMKTDPARYLYRRYRETLSANDDFETGAIKGCGMWYSLKKPDKHHAEICNHAHEDRENSPATASDYYTLPFPEHLFNERNTEPERLLFRTGTLVKIARFFWIQARDNGLPPQIPIQELTGYTIFHLPWAGNPETISLVRHNHDATQGAECEIELTTEEGSFYCRPEELAGIAMSVRSIAVMAQELAAICSPEECAVFLMRTEEPPVKLREIAEILKLKDQNRANSLYRSFTKKLTRHVSTWPGPRLDELPQQAIDLFMEELRRLCKKKAMSP